MAAIEAERYDPEAIMGQFLYAAGAGAGGQWVRTGAIRFLRERFLPAIERAIEEGADWSSDAPFVLHYMEAIGRLATNLAIAEGDAAISQSVMRQATDTVGIRYRAAARSSEASRGPWCRFD